MHEEGKHLEIKPVIVQQHDFKRNAMGVCTAIDREDELSKKLINVFKDNELGLKFVSFLWSASNGAVSSKQMNYCNKDDVF